jgi:hypothetical protein
MSQNVELVIPYYRCANALFMLLRSVSNFCLSELDIVIIASEKEDFNVDDFAVKTGLNIVYVNMGILNQDERMYSYLSTTIYEKSIVTHTDVEIIEHDPILEILKISSIDENIGLIGKLVPGRFSSNYEEYLRPWVSSHFCLINNKLMNKYVKKIHSGDVSTKEHGFSVGGQDIFPAGVYHYASYKGIECLNLPRSIESKLVHYNSVTRRHNIQHGFVQNDNSIRTSQLDVVSGMLNLRSKLETENSIDNIVIIGVGEDAIDTYRMSLEEYPSVEIYFCERFSPVHGQIFEDKKVISFGESTNLTGKVFYYVCTPDYRWFVDKLVFCGLRYGLDYRIRLIHGNDFIQSEFPAFFPGDNNDIAAVRNGVMLPNNNFIDSPNTGYVSIYHMYRYSIALFFVILRKPIDWLLLKNRAKLGLKRFKGTVKNVK